MQLATKKLMPEIRQFLNNIRESGAINPLAATPDIMSEFSITRSEARAAIQMWMTDPDGTKNQD